MYRIDPFLFHAKVAWVRVDTHSILTIHNKVITRNYRIGLPQADGRNWVLKISNVAESDRGFYMCQVRKRDALTPVGEHQMTRILKPILADQHGPDALPRSLRRSCG